MVSNIAAEEKRMSIAALKTRLGRIGIWSMELRFGDGAEALSAAAELDTLGFSALWVPGGIGGDITGDMSRLRDATQKAVICSGIINIWKHTPEEIGAWWSAQTPAQQSRLLLGLGVSHGPIIGDAYGKPLAVMNKFLDGLAAQKVPAEALCLAALKPKMLELARTRTAGAHPYLVTPEHTAEARKILGPDALLAPEQGVILDTDPATARAKARTVIGHYARLPNYRTSWLRLGFSEAEIDAGADHLVDALFAWGSLEAIAARIKAHHDAGADHVCLQLITGAERPSVAAALPGWRQLAALL
jgi:probable F420-dependent oxidoreductase